MKINFLKPAAFLLSIALFTGCSENYSNGERIGLITQFSRTGIFWKSWEGELHVTQTGMNSTMKDFDFSIDNDRENERTTVIAILDSAAKNGWKVRLIYHECQGENITGSRGGTNHFIDSVQVLDKNMSTLFNNNPKDTALRQGRIIDTIYVVIDKSKN